MSLDPVALAWQLSAETGLEFSAFDGRDGQGHRWVELRPTGHATSDTFALRTTIAWRRLEIEFKPGAFAGDLLEAMASAGVQERAVFASVLRQCLSDGATLELTINGRVLEPDAPEIWQSSWRSCSFKLIRRHVPVGAEDEDQDQPLVRFWTGRIAAAVVALLPLEAPSELAELPEEFVGLPEGAKTKIEVNRYERDRRNRAAALCIHGYSCKACDLDLAERYGHAAAGLIEVHHVTPVSMLGEGYVIDPARDLVPLCPNCHAVAHRRSPPFSVEELRSMVALVPTPKP